MTLKEAVIDGKKIRVIYEINDLAGIHNCYNQHIVEVQIKKFFFYTTIKRWSYLTMDFLDNDDIEQIEFIKNEAIELFNNIFNPYKIEE